MRSVNVAELKNRLSLYLRAVRAGQELVVRDRKTPVARILPIGDAASAGEELRALAAQGKLHLGRAIEASFWSLPAPRVPAHALKRALERERDES